jgi:adenine nucleotide transporter 17
LSLNPSITLAFFQLFRRLLTLADSRNPNHLSAAVGASNATSELAKAAVKTAQADPTPREAFVGAAISNSIGTACFLDCSFQFLTSSLAVTLLYPIILAKTRLQASSANSLQEVMVDAYHGKIPALRRSKGTLATVSGNPGMQGLYQGFEMQIVKGFLSQGVTFLVKGRQVLVYTIS